MRVPPPAPACLGLVGVGTFVELTGKAEAAALGLLRPVASMNSPGLAWPG